MGVTNAYQYVTGPVHCFARFSRQPTGIFGTTVGSGEIYYLGTCEEFPEIQLDRHWKSVKNDLSGDFIAFDKEFHGMDGMIIMDLNRKNEANVAELAQLTSFEPTFAGQQDFALSRIEIGSLAIANGCAFELWLQFSFFGTTNANAYPDLPPGYYFRACVNPQRMDSPTGTRVNKSRLIMEVQNVYQPATGGFFLGSSFASYFTGLPQPL